MPGPKLNDAKTCKQSNIAYKSKAAGNEEKINHPTYIYYRPKLKNRLACKLLIRKP